MRTTLRMMSRRPGFSLLAGLTLALGITAATVVFSLAYGMLLSPLPYANAARLVLVWEFDRTSHNDPGEDFGPVTTIAPQNLNLWRQKTATLARLDGLTFGFFSITQGASPTEVIGGRVTPGFFAGLGVTPLLGRTLAPGDPDDVVVLGHSFWRTQYGGDRAIVGRQVLLAGAKYTVIGVLPPQFFFYMREFALWTPLPAPQPGRRVRPLMGVGLLRPGVTQAQAQTEFEALASRLEGHRGVRVMSLRAQYSRFFRPTLMVLLASVGLLLLIACANVASLLLARATEREQEMAIRAALGATRRRLVSQLLGENLVLALFADAAGVLAAWFLIPLARTLLPLKLPVPIPGVEEIGLSAPVLLFSLTATLATVLIFGLAPAFRAATAGLGARSTSPGAAQRRFLDAIVVAELALSVVLLTGAGLAMRSVYSLFHATGFRADHILTFRTPTAGLAPERLNAFYQDVLEHLRTLPGVRTAAAAYNFPGGGGNGTAPIFVEGGSIDPKEAGQAGVNPVSGEFFDAFSIPLLSGRTFSTRDTPGAPEVAILSAGLARKLFPGADSVGRRVRIGDQAGNRWLVVAGIVGDVRPLLSDTLQPMIYRPFTQDPPGATGFVLRTAGPPLDLAAAAQREVWRIRPGQPITYVDALEDDLDQQGFRERLSAIGIGWFAGFGLLLAAVGIYSLMAYVVKQRLKEFGVRVAIGATATDLVILVFRRGAALVGVGLLLGLAASLLLARMLKSLLYGVGSIDAPSLLASSLLLAAVAFAACYGPARKAGLVDPMTVLRGE
ncbi:MAG TPA: ABC transporter permease [Candidatus Sulfopaludibacter sp.]|jgi:putative ABC transport system permease protein|nr:ABC transporter permease [Candidatus Sulfopaludibacter sp.]